jgi:hypothetical protein
MVIAKATGDAVITTRIKVLKMPEGSETLSSVSDVALPTISFSILER